MTPCAVVTGTVECSGFDSVIENDSSASSVRSPITCTTTVCGVASPDAQVRVPGTTAWKSTPTTAVPPNTA